MRGFSLVELLIAMSITLLMMGATLSFIAPTHDAFQVQPESADVQQRMRVGVDALLRDLLMAGAGMYAAGQEGPLNRAIAPVMPYRAFSASSTASTFRTDTVSLLFVPSTPAQTTLATPMAPGSLAIAIARSANCPADTAKQACGFEAGDQLLIFDGNGLWDLYEVDRVDGGGRLQLKGQPPARGFAAHANVAEVRAITYALKPDAQSGASQLVRSYGRDSAQPLVDNVVGLTFQYFGDPQPPQFFETTSGDATVLHSTYGPPPPALTTTLVGWPPGENCTFTRVEGRHQSRMGPLGAANALVEISPALVSDGPWCPDATAPNRFDADLLRVRLIRFTLRVQTPVAALRGPASTLFTFGGLAKAGTRYVPDLQIQLDVAPRNLN